MTPSAPRAFQAFTIKFNGIVPRIITGIGVSAAFDPATPPSPAPLTIQTTALWDTGATRSVISSGLASALTLQPVGATQVSHAGGTSNSPTYIVNLMLPNTVGVAGVLVTEFPNINGGFSAIVGMDVIGLGDLALSNVAGRTSMSFRIPSCEVIDYVIDANRIRFAGTGRNDPCPCGAKKPDGTPVKYKQCHGAVASP